MDYTGHFTTVQLLSSYCPDFFEPHGPGKAPGWRGKPHAYIKISILLKCPQSHRKGHFRGFGLRGRGGQGVGSPGAFLGPCGHRTKLRGYTDFLFGGVSREESPTPDNFMLKKR